MGTTAATGGTLGQASVSPQPGSPDVPTKYTLTLPLLVFCSPLRSWMFGETKMFGKHLWFHLHILLQVRPAVTLYLPWLSHLSPTGRHACLLALNFRLLLRFTSQVYAAPNACMPLASNSPPYLHRSPAPTPHSAVRHGVFHRQLCVRVALPAGCGQGRPHRGQGRQGALVPRNHRHGARRDAGGRGGIYIWISVGIHVAGCVTPTYINISVFQLLTVTFSSHWPSSVSSPFHSEGSSLLPLYRTTFSLPRLCCSEVDAFPIPGWFTHVPELFRFVDFEPRISPSCSHISRVVRTLYPPAIPTTNHHSTKVSTPAALR